MSSVGVVSVLDILGYKNFLNNNDAGEIAEEILGVLNNAKDKTKEMAFLSLAKEAPHREELERIFGKIQWLVFADTILLACAYPSSADEKNKLECWSSVCYASRFLYSHLFAWGLPVRGAISYGNFLIEGNCFAGSPISEASQKAQELELSAIVLAGGKAEEEYLQHTTERGMWEKNRYSFPIKGDKDERLISFPPFAMNSLLYKGVRGSIINAFAAHNKSIGSTVINKINNTEIFFEWCLEKERHHRGEK